MALLKCKMCGGTLTINDDSGIATCEYCCTKQTISKTTDDVISNLYNRANNLRLKNEFDKALSIYEKIVEQDDSESEAHWGIVLCKYGIEYVDDPNTGKKVPTCHRTSFDSIKNDIDYQAAIDYSSSEQQTLYEEEAREIDRLQKEILSIAKNEKPFDVFICYKETDESGKRTVDSVLANDIYYQLTQDGYKAFYAAITLEDKLGQEYEPYIFSALNSAKVMLVIGTKPEYFNAVWVKNEWSRFLSLMKKDRTKALIPCYRDMDAYNLPEEFAHLQAQDMSKIGFINDIIRGIDKIIKNEKKTIEIVNTFSNKNDSINSLLTRIGIFIEDGDWENSNQYCEKVLDIDPENGQVYLYKLLTDYKLKKIEDLEILEEPFDNNNNYKKALKYGTTDIKNKLEGINYFVITKKNEKETIEMINTALDDWFNGSINRDYNNKTLDDSENNIITYFSKTIDFIKERNLTENIKEFLYQKSLEYLNFGLNVKGNESYEIAIDKLEIAIECFSIITGYKDSNSQLSICQKALEELKAKEEARIEYERKAEEARIEQEKIAKKKKKILGLIALLCVVIMIIIVTIVIPTINKNNFINKYSKEAYDRYGLVEKGKYITFGSYEQDNNTSNGKEPIEWLVLDIKDNKALIISKYVLDCKHYDEYKPISWDTCSLRTWLNNTFLNDAFNPEEQIGLKYTRDTVSLLSPSEAREYFTDNESRKCVPTDYAVAQGVSQWWNIKINGVRTCNWWLRTMRFNSVGYALVDCVDGTGDFDDRCYDVEFSYCGDTGVRPALWINLES